MKTPFQQLLHLLAEAEAAKPKPVEIPQKFVDEWNQFGEIRSREEFLKTVKEQIRT